jgi:RNA-binding protein YlmH
VSGPEAGFIWDALPWREVLARLERLADGHGGQAATGFLDTHQWCYLRQDARLIIDGGQPQAQYRRAAISAAPAVRYFRVERAALPEGVRTAKQLRAWLYRGGLPAGAVGDIVLGEYAVLVVEGGIELAEVGLAAKLVTAWQPPETPVVRVTAAGLRADAITAAVFKVSRGEAQTAIKYGFIFCDFKPVEKQTHALHPGAQLVYRTKGRADIAALSENTKSGRLWVEYRLYPA